MQTQIGGEHGQTQTTTYRRIYRWLGPEGKHFDRLWVTNACPQLVSSARGRGKPDPEWLAENLWRLQPIDLLLVCGKVAQQTYNPDDAGGARIVEIPHPAARLWNKKALEAAAEEVRKGTNNVSLKILKDGIQSQELTW